MLHMLSLLHRLSLYACSSCYAWFLWNVCFHYVRTFPAMHIFDVKASVVSDQLHEFLVLTCHKWCFCFCLFSWIKKYQYHDICLRMCAFIWTYVYAHTRACYVCISTYLHTHNVLLVVFHDEIQSIIMSFLCTCTFMKIHMYTHTCTPAHRRIWCMYNTHAHMHTCTHAHMHTCTHAHEHVRTACTVILDANTTRVRAYGEGHGLIGKYRKMQPCALFLRSFARTHMEALERLPHWQDLTCSGHAYLRRNNIHKR